MAKIKAIIKRPDEEYGHMTNISGEVTINDLRKGGNEQNRTDADGVR